VSPAAAYSYSNLGYILAGAMLERVADAAWEDLVREHVFGPLGMEGAGFGGVGTPGELDQPWGHRDNGRPASGNGPAVDNPPVLGPAGRVHAPIQDWAKFIADQLRGATGAPGLLSAESYTRLHTAPAGSDYSLGWLVLSRDWGGGAVLHHAGSNTMNFSNVWIAPARNVAFLVCINQGGDTAFQASDQAVSALIALHDAQAVAAAE
jgi:D-alanyl-D-alanine carboxypeptidase